MLPWGPFDLLCQAGLLSSPPRANLRGRPGAQQQKWALIIAAITLKWPGDLGPSFHLPILQTWRLRLQGMA